MPRPKRYASKTQYNNQRIAQSYDRINLVVPKGDKARIAARAREIGLSTNAHINRLIYKDLDEAEG